MQASSSTFQPRVRHQDAKLFYIVFGIAFLIGIVSLFFSNARLVGCGIVAFSGLILFLLWQQNTASDMRYELQDQGVFLKRFYFKRLIPYSEIQRVEVLDEKEIEPLLREKLADEIVRRNQLDFQAFATRKSINEVFKYASVPVIFTSQTSNARVLSQEITMKSDFVLLALKGDQMYVLTPEDTATFAAELKRRIPLIDP